jgi:UDP-GlcNAc:undecaprenyl-phosphate GlcNAc-1-phosphate transferase
MNFLIYFVLALALALALTPLVKRFALRTGCVDLPDQTRKLHSRPTPLLGGLALFLSFGLALLAYLRFAPIDFLVVPIRFFVGILSGGAVLMVGGFLDDKYRLPAKLSWIFPALAALAIVLSGIGVGIRQISNPFGAPLRFDFMVFGVPVAAFLVWLWMMGMMFTTKFLDGLDGLAGGVSFIASLTLFFLSLTAKVNQPITATIAIILCGALTGYLVYNFPPASIFLGEGGSTFLGFILGVLSIILGGKIATALLVMGIPILDVAWVIVRRLWYRSSPFRGDRQHLHFRLVDLGMSQRQAILTLYAISAVFGFTAVFLQSFGKLIALIILFAIMIVLVVGVVLAYKSQNRKI